MATIEAPVRPELLDASDAFIDDVVNYAEPMVLRGLIWLLTDDPEIAATAVQPVTIGYMERFALAGDAETALVRRKAAAFLEDLATDKPLELARSAICPSHYMAVIDLYRATGDEQYLRLSEAFVRVRDDFEGGDDNQDRVPVREQTVVAGHAAPCGPEGAESR